MKIKQITKNTQFAVLVCLQHGTIVTDGLIFKNFTDEDLLKPASNTYELHTYYLDCDNVTNTQRFYMDTDSGQITYDSDFDLDISGTPDEVSCTVTITDGYGLSNSLSLYIHINNRNESTPQFTHSSYVFFVDATALIGTYLGTVSAFDFDSADNYNNHITFSVEGSYSSLLAVNNNGAIYLIGQPDPGITTPIYILATNQPDSSTTGTATITIIVPITTTVTTTTTDRDQGCQLF